MTDQIVGKGARKSLRKYRKNQFSPRKQQTFLDALALTCNVRHAAERAGVHYATAYLLRQRDQDFATRWQEAIVSACDRLEMLVLEHGGAGVPLERGDAERAGGDGAGVPFDFNRAIATLRHFREQREGRPLASGGNLRSVATRDELTAALTRALAAVQRGLVSQAHD